MAYRAEIEIGVKGLQQLKNFQKTIKELNTQVDLINDLSKQFELPIQNIEAYNRNLQITAKTLKEVRIGSEQEADAIKDYVAALGQANAARDRQNKLIEEQISLQEFARKGQGPSSPTALSSPLPAFVGPRQATSSQTQAAVTQGVREMEEVYASLDRIQAKQVTRENERVEALGRGTQEVLELARAAKMGPKLPPGFNFKEAELRVKTRLAEDATIKEINKRRVQERELLSTQITYDLKATQARLDNNDKVFKDRIRKNKQELDDFDRRLRQRDQARASRSATRRAALGSAIIGGAFPLLFGQGAGAAVGGGLGGAAGGLIGGQFGFGLSLVGTAIGQAFDTFTTNAANLGKALNPLTADIKTLTEAAGLSGTATEKLIQSVEGSVGVLEAQELATAQLAVVVGEEGVRALQEYGDSTTELSSELAKAFTALQAAMAPVLASITDFVTQQIKRTRLVERAVEQNLVFGLELKPEFADNKVLQKAILDFNKGKLTELELEKQIIEQVTKKDNLTQAAADAQLQGTAARNFEGQILAQNNVILAKNKDLTDAAVQAAEREKLEIELTNREAKILAENRRNNLTTAKMQQELDNLYLDINNKKLALNNSIAKAEEAKAAKLERATQASLRADRKTQKALEKENKVRSSLAKIRVQEIDQSIKYAGSEATRVAISLDLLSEREEKEIEAIRLGSEDERLKNRRIELLKVEYTFKRRILEQTQQELAAYGAIAKLSAAAGFQVSGDSRVGFVPEDAAGILGGVAGPSFEAGAELTAIVKQEVALERVLEKYQQIGQAAQLTSELVTTGFQDMLTGTKSAEEVFANFLRNLAEMLIKTAQQMIATYIAIGIARAFGLGQSPAVGTRASDFNLTGFGNLGSDAGSGISGFLAAVPGIAGKANGGPVSTGTPYMVGERGPELFVPSSSGTIVPNNALGGDVNVVVNVTETQTDTRGNGARANQVGNALAAAVQAEIIKQKRPGGLLAN